MPIFLQSKDFPLKIAEVRTLWRETIARRGFSDAQVNIKCVSAEEIRTMNKHYRRKDKPTNVLTFSYEDEHDIVLCLPLAEAEAAGRGVKLRDYVALLLVHAFLHATGMDHEQSEEEERETEVAEREILRAAGFSENTLAHNGVVL